MRVLRRVDVRLALLIGGATAIFTSLLLAGLLAYALSEALEEQVAFLDDATAVLDTVLPDAGASGTVAWHRGIAYRVHDAAGRVVAAGGGPRPAGGVARDLSLRSAIVASASDYVTRRRDVGGGRTAEVALSLRHFARERRELVRSAAIVVLLGILGSLVIGMLAARRALAPLRDTTAAIRAIDSQRLDARIPTRATGDDVDALAAATNEVLGRLEQAFGRISGFSADVAHELRTPVNRILNRTEVALMAADDPAAKDDALAAIRGTADEMRTTIEQLLLLAKGENGHLRVARESIDLAALAEGLVSLYAPAAERIGKTIRLSAGAVRTLADRALVERALANLLDNAVRHSAPASVIAVGVASTDGQAIVTVEDSGPGVAECDRERVFDRFVRLDPARGAGGVGLGLTMARMIARLHDGDVAVERSHLGGAAFRLTLALS